MILNLTTNERLITPHFIVEKIHFKEDDLSTDSARFKADLTSTLLQDRQAPCHYHGDIVGESGSRVAMSTCHGLVSLLWYYYDSKISPRLNNKMSFSRNSNKINITSFFIVNLAMIPFSLKQPLFKILFIYVTETI